METIVRKFTIKKTDNIFEIDNNIYICRSRILYLFDPYKQSLSIIHENIPKRVIKMNIYRGIYMFCSNKYKITLIKKSAKVTIELSGYKISFRNNMILASGNYDLCLYFIDENLRVVKKAVENSHFYCERAYFVGNEIFIICDRIILYVYNLDLNLIRTTRNEKYKRYYDFLFLKEGYIHQEDIYEPYKIEIKNRTYFAYTDSAITINDFINFASKEEKQIKIISLCFETNEIKETFYPLDELYGHITSLRTCYIHDSYLIYQIQYELPYDFAKFDQKIKEIILILAMIFRRRNLDRFTSYRIIGQILSAELKN